MHALVLRDGRMRQPNPPDHTGGRKTCCRNSNTHTGLASSPVPETLRLLEHVGTDHRLHLVEEDLLNCGGLVCSYTGQDGLSSIATDLIKIRYAIINIINY